jgi:hypothetical protein
MTPYQQTALDQSRVQSIRVIKVIVVESHIGDGDKTPIRPFIEIFDMDGNEVLVGDVTQGGA